MKIEPIEQNIVIVGSWNSAILTPKGIHKYLFNQKNPIRFNIGVPIETNAPYRVTHQGVVVMAHPDKLVIQAERPDLTSLNKAKIAGVRVLRKLPVTPFKGAGINLKFRVEHTGRDRLKTGCGLDKGLERNKFDVIARFTQRSVKFKKGRLNIISEEESEEFSFLTFNFEMRSEDPLDLREWLSIDVQELEKVRLTIMGQVFGLPVERVS